MTNTKILKKKKKEKKEDNSEGDRSQKTEKNKIKLNNTEPKSSLKYSERK